MPFGREEVLPRGGLVRSLARAADGQHRGLGGGRDRVAPDLRVADEDDRARRRVDHLVVERERRSAREDDVDLLVPERLLRVLLDDGVPGVRRDVRVDSEGADVQRPTNRAPEERAADDRNRLDLLEPDAAPPVGHDERL